MGLCLLSVHGDESISIKISFPLLFETCWLPDDIPPEAARLLPVYAFKSNPPAPCIWNLKCFQTSCAILPRCLPEISLYNLSRYRSSRQCSMGLDISIHHRMVPQSSSLPMPPVMVSFFRKQFQKRRVSSPAPVTITCPSGLMARYSTR